MCLGLCRNYSTCYMKSAEHLLLLCGFFCQEVDEMGMRRRFGLSGCAILVWSYHIFCCALYFYMQGKALAAQQV